MKTLRPSSTGKDITPVLLINGKLATKQELRRVGIVAQAASIDPDPEYTAWKRANGLTTMSRAAYVQEFSIY